MKVIKSKILFDGVDERQNYFIGFEDDEIKYLGSSKPQEESEIIAEDVVVTPAFIDSHSHIRMIRSGEPDREEEAN
ncbi:MAG TPA: hypothetical protein VE818_06275, partial [Nitrososphaeraceae archaeon]|nr:hypothetical protein [Nitrososphaeraceae archaeon]